ncbi:Uncharacterised protein [Leclercia adecarboxylata]|uniref:Uncharacterized protein n=1 Tax=Leclercia adecarboxylata TaxID=83655 RepID=A0A4U9HY40_9ENTR|nr:Uncharacterised protein [Leclercia adecarboxylata]
MYGALPDADGIMQIIENKAANAEASASALSPPMVIANSSPPMRASMPSFGTLSRNAPAMMTIQLIAHLMPVDIIHVFKAVEVDKDHALRIGIAAQAYPLQLFNQRPAVR